VGSGRDHRSPKKDADLDGNVYGLAQKSIDLHAVVPYATGWTPFLFPDEPVVSDGVFSLSSLFF
jgi:hypothetical protein